MDIEKINIELATKTPLEIVQWAITNAQTPILTTNFRPYESAILHLVTTVNPFNSISQNKPQRIGM